VPAHRKKQERKKEIGNTLSRKLKTENSGLIGSDPPFFLANPSFVRGARTSTETRTRTRSGSYIFYHFCPFIVRIEQQLWSVLA